MNNKKRKKERRKFPSDFDLQSLDLEEEKVFMLEYSQSGLTAKKLSWEKDTFFIFGENIRCRNLLPSVLSWCQGCVSKKKGCYYTPNRKKELHEEAITFLQELGASHYNNKWKRDYRYWYYISKKKVEKNLTQGNTEGRRIIKENKVYALSIAFLYDMYNLSDELQVSTFAKDAWMEFLQNKEKYLDTLVVKKAQDYRIVSDLNFQVFVSLTYEKKNTLKLTKESQPEVFNISSDVMMQNTMETFGEMQLSSEQVEPFPSPPNQSSPIQLHFNENDSSIAAPNNGRNQSSNSPPIPFFCDSEQNNFIERNGNEPAIFRKIADNKHYKLDWIKFFQLIKELSDGRMATLLETIELSEEEAVVGLMEIANFSKL